MNSPKRTTSQLSTPLPSGSLSAPSCPKGSPDPTLSYFFAHTIQGNKYFQAAPAGSDSPLAQARPGFYQFMTKLQTYLSKHTQAKKEGDEPTLPFVQTLEELCKKEVPPNFVEALVQEFQNDEDLQQLESLLTRNDTFGKMAHYLAGACLLVAGIFAIANFALAVPGLTVFALALLGIAISIVGVSSHYTGIRTPANGLQLNLDALLKDLETLFPLTPDCKNTPSLYTIFHIQENGLNLKKDAFLSCDHMDDIMLFIKEKKFLKTLLKVAQTYTALEPTSPTTATTPDAIKRALPQNTKQLS